MTEQELRESLQTHLATADLPDHRKQALLANLRAEAPPAHEKGDTPMFRPNKFRTVLIAALIVTLLSATVALAAGFSGYVNFKGEPVERIPMAQPTPMPTEGPAPDELTDEAFTNILNAAMQGNMGYMVDVSYDDGLGHSKGGSQLKTLRTQDLAELTALLDSHMPLPRIPEGFTFQSAFVQVSCDSDSAYELHHEETTPEGVVIRRYDIPEGAAVPVYCSLNLKNAADDIIYCSIDLGFTTSGYHFGVSEEDVIKTPDVPGMDDALLIIKPGNTRLAMRYTLDEPVTLWSQHPGTWDHHPYETYDTMEFNLDSDTVPADVLLSMVQ